MDWISPETPALERRARRLLLSIVGLAVLLAGAQCAQTRRIQVRTQRIVPQLFTRHLCLLQGVCNFFC
jgi:hypothetical protein